MCKNFHNILITGASSGIGAALALYYAKNGAKNLFLCGRNKERLKEIEAKCQTFGANVKAEILDVCDKEKTEKWIKKCNAQAALNLVFANAGVSTGAETAQNVYNTFQTNIFGVLNTLLPTLEIYEKRQEKSARALVIISSMAGYHGLAGCPSYSASKACVKAYGEALRPRLARQFIQLNVVCPGFVRSRITDKNTCPMPFFMEADRAAEIIAKGVSKNTGLISFPLMMRVGAWFGSVLPNCLSNFLYAHLPYKV